MKNILLSNFESLFSLEGYLLEVNLKLANSIDEERLKTVLKNLSSIVIAFDFKFNGPYKSYIDKRYSYEQFLYLCYLKINESKFSIHENHMLKSMKKFGTATPSLNLNFINMPQKDLEKKLLAIENMSLCYFLSHSHDGIYWRELHDLIGSSIMKYIFIYSFVFRRLNNKNSSNVYVQVAGRKLNTIYKKLTANKLKEDEEFLIKKSLNNSKKNLKENKNSISIKKPFQNETKETPKKLKNLKLVFDLKDEELLKELDDVKSAAYQLKKIGHEALNKTSILYDRNLASKIGLKYIYSNLKTELNLISARKIVDTFILHKINFESYSEKDHLEEMKVELSECILGFMRLYRTCPFLIFLNYFCQYKKRKATQIKANNTVEQNDISDKIVKSNSVKRKRSAPYSEAKLSQKNTEISLKIHIEKKNVYAFVRRCLMYTLDYKNKLISKRSDSSCLLLGGKYNFNVLVKKLHKIIGSLKYDTYILNSLLHNLKLSRIKYLKPIKCDRFKRLILISVLRWLIEDFAFQIIKSRFYVTDTSRTNSALFYYLKSDWKKIFQSQLSTRNYSELYNLEKITESDVKAYCSKYECSGIHLGRLLPKNFNNECRIISGCKVINPCTKKTCSINYKFITLNQSLKWLITKEPSLVGFASQGHRETYKLYSKFLSLNYLNRSFNKEPDSVVEPLKKWNFMKFDLEKCFDNIDTKRLIQFISGLYNKYLGSDHVFTLLKYTKVQFDTDNKTLKVKYDYFTLRHHLHEKGGNDQKTLLLFLQQGFSNGISDFIKLMEEDNSNSTSETCNKENKTNSNYIKNKSLYFDAIYIPLTIHDRNISARQLKYSLKRCLEHVVIKIHDEIFERMTGILQGSICSRNLCDIYLGSIELKLFSYDNNFEQTTQLVLDGGLSVEIPFKLIRSNEIILRNVDDYLIISSEYDRLIQIKNLIKVQLIFNEKKTVFYKWTKQQKYQNNAFPIISKKLDELEHLVDNMNFKLMKNNNDLFYLKNHSGLFFEWCGFNIDVNTLDIYLNYDKYFDNPGSLKNRINCSNSIELPFIQFNLKFLRLFTVNISNLLIDLKINNVQAILRNIVDLFALSVIRFFLLYNTMPKQLISNSKLQLKLMLNLCYWLNNRLSSNLIQQLLQHFYSCLSLFKFLCLKTYVYLIESLKINNKNASKKHSEILKLIKKTLEKLSFKRCIKINNEHYYDQINQILEEQLAKFKKCII